MQTLGDIFVEKCRESGVEKVAIVEGVMLEHHEIGDEEGVLQPRVVRVAGLYAAHRLEAPVELWKEVGREVDGGCGETAGEGGGVELAVEDAAVEAGVVGGVEEAVKATACEHEGQERARGRG